MERDLEGLFLRQQHFFNNGKTKPIAWRLKQLRRLRRLVTDNVAVLIETLAAEIQTAWFDHAIEIDRGLEAIDHALANLKGWTDFRTQDLRDKLRESWNQTIPDGAPYGSVLIITPVNAPLGLFLQPLIAAICAGNTAIVTFDHPAAPLSSLFADLFPDYLEEATVAFVGADQNVLTRLLTLPFPFVFFTGHADAGRVVVRATADRPTTVTLELNGHNPVIVDETANVEEAANRIVRATMAFGGQWCVAPSYVYVHETIADTFLEACVGAVETLFGDDPQKSRYLPPMKSARDAERLIGLFQGAPIILGGEGDGKTRYVAPTIVYPASWLDPIMQSDIRGPVLPILPYKTLNAVLEIIDRKPESLAIYLFSGNDKTIRDFVDALSLTGGAVNAELRRRFSPTADPFGGVGVSRLGRHFGRLGYDAFSRSALDILANGNHGSDAHPLD